MRSLSLILALALSISLGAHNPLTAKFELNASLPQGAVLNIYLSQAGLHQALLKHYTNIDLSTLSENAYKQLCVRYLKEHTALQADKTSLQLGEGGIKLGHHQTDLKFFIENYPPEVHKLKVHISAFQENGNHHSVFWWKKQAEESKLILSKSNAFQGELGIPVQIAAVGNKTQIPLILVLLMGLGVLVFALSRPQKKNVQILSDKFPN